MSWLSRVANRATRVPGVGSGRHITERAVAPYLRADFESFRIDLLGALHDLSCRIDEVERRVALVEEHQPPVLNAIASVNGNARLTRREMTEIRAHLDELEARVGARATVD
jgi:hypothetical protein